MITRLETGRARARMPRSLILAPTRELAAQVAQSFEKYGVNHKLQLALLIGGVSMDDQVKKLDRGVDVLIATPGRLLDHFGRGRIMLMGVEILVIDEADRMLDMGFIPDIEKICKLLPPRRQTLFFSATMPPEITRLVNQFLTNPERVEVAKPATTAKTITQHFVYCQNGEDWAKREVLRNLIRDGNVKNAIIFCNRKRDVAVLFKSLTKHGFNAGALHGDMEQSARTETLDKFRNGEIMLLAASDVAARGLDIPEVSHVFNFDLPWAADDYVHRIGRTGRAGHEGHSISIVSPDDLKFVKDIEKVTAETAVWLGEPPTEEDIAGAGKRRRGRGGRTGGPPEKSGRSQRGSRSGHREPRAQAERSGERSAERHAERPRTQAPVREQDQLLDQTRAEQPTTDRPAGRTEQPRPPSRQAAQPQSERPARSSARHNQRQPQVDAWTDEPRKPRRPESTPEKRQSTEEQARKSAPPPQKGGERLGFAENVPAFMRKPSRPMKVPGRG
jgi:superfamily II DNA/RNA helicase